MRKSEVIAILSALLLAGAAAAAIASFQITGWGASNMPVVDLGYVLHRAASFNVSKPWRLL